MNTFNVHDDLKSLDLEGLINYQRESSLPYAVCCLNLTGDLNLGVILRTACIFGASKAIIFGKRRYDRRSTVGAQNYLDLHRYDGLDENEMYCPVKFAAVMEEHNLAPIFVEQGGEDLMDHNSTLIDDLMPCYVFGNEGDGIPESLIGDSPKLSIDQVGVLRSLNVAAAASIVIHHVYQQMLIKKLLKNI